MTAQDSVAQKNSWNRTVLAVVFHRSIVGPLVAVVVLLLVWEAVARAGLVAPFLLPRPTRIGGWLLENGHLLWPHIVATTTATVLGFLFAVAFGIFLAVIMVWSRFLEDTLYPLIVATQVFPKIAVAPLVVIYLGFGLSSKVFLAFLLAFFPVTVNAVLGLKSVHPDMLDLLTSLRAKKRQIFTKVRLPNAMPYIVEGAKIGIALAIIGTVVGEFVAGSRGLGFLISQASYTLNTTQAYSAMLVLVAVGLVLFQGVASLGSLLIPWARREGSKAG